MKLLILSMVNIILVSIKINNSGYLGSGVYLKRAIKIYGKENFIRETLKEFSSKHDAYNFERNIVNMVLVNNPNCYNIKMGGEGGGLGGENHSQFGTHRSEETKLKLRTSCSGKNHRLYGKHHSEETKKRISNSNKNKKFSSQRCKNISKGKRTRLWNINGEIFTSLIDASIHFNVSVSTISRWCSPNKKYNKVNCSFISTN